MSVQVELIRLGGRRIGTDFSQGKFRGAIVNAEGKSLTSGYCAGVALDWARRVLQSDPGRDESYYSYSAAYTQLKKDAVVKRMAKAYADQSDGYSAVSKDAALQELAKLKLLPETQHSEYGTGVLVSNKVAKVLGGVWEIGVGSFTKFNLSKEPAGTLPKHKIETLMNSLNAGQNVGHGAKSADGLLWANHAAKLDERFRQLRQATGKAGIPQKKFGNLEVRETSPQRKYESAGHWRHALEHHAFAPNCCTIVNLQQSGQDSGHAVAVQQRGADDFVFFDPNWGAFCFSKEKLDECFQHLFQSRITWADEGALDGENAVYLRRAKSSDPEEGPWDQMGYTIFKRKAVLDNAV